MKQFAMLLILHSVYVTVFVMMLTPGRVAVVMAMYKGDPNNQANK